MPESQAKAIITINGKAHDVVTFYYSLYRSLEHHGKPTGSVMGGIINFTINTTDLEKIELISLCTSKSTFSGSITIRKSDGKSELRKIEFKGAYITSFSESLSGHDHLSSDVQLSAEELKLGDAVHENQWGNK